MNIQAYKTTNDKRYLEVVEPLTRDDVTVEIIKPTADKVDKRVEGGLKVVLKDDVAKMVLKALNAKQQEPLKDYSLSDLAWAELCTWAGSAVYTLARNIDFRGCRKQSTIDKKYDDVIMEFAAKLLMKQDVYVNSHIKKFNDALESRCKVRNRSYETVMDDVYLGRTISKDWMKKHLDGDVPKELEAVEKELSALQKQKDELLEKRKRLRNRNMYLYITGINWGEDDEEWDHDPLPNTLREKYEEAYKNNEAFEINRSIW
jgi:hypothetical protein